MKLSIYQADAFTDTLFQGNPAAVCPLEEWLDDGLMQKIAAENNLSETSFFVRLSDGSYDLRWFTPVHEVDLCGHATLASAHILFTQLGYEGDMITFRSRSGDLLVSRRQNGYGMEFPADPTSPTEQAGMNEIIGTEVLGLYRGISDLLVEVKDEATVRNLDPDFRRMVELNYRGCIVTAKGNETDIVSRCFYPAYGIDEDPVTGSAHTTLFSHWGSKLGKSELTAAQLSDRGGRVTGKVYGDRVLLTGSAVLYLTGEIYT